jgi:hypothetical protein
MPSGLATDRYVLTGSKWAALLTHLGCPEPTVGSGVELDEETMRVWSSPAIWAERDAGATSWTSSQSFNIPRSHADLVLDHPNLGF